MNIIRYSIDRPVAVIAAVLIAVLFGMLALSRIPIQLAPDVRKPIVVVQTSWPGAAPSEIEREIVNLQEETLRGLDGLEIMTSRSRTGEASVTLEFAVGTDMSQSLLLVSNRLDRVSDYPAEASQPTLNTSGADDSPIAWVLMTAQAGNTRAMPTYGDFLEDVIKDRVERIEGVSAVNVFGGTQRELQVIVDPQRLSRYGLTVPEVVRVLRSENISVSAGDVDEGKRRYVVRTQSNLNTEDAIRNVVLRSDVAGGGVGRVRVLDVADVSFAYQNATSRLRFQGQPGLAFNVVRESGANVISVMEEFRVVLEELRVGPLNDVGLDAEQVYDETIYIQGAIDLVVQNIWIGAALAAGILLLFLRSPRATIIVSLAIPVSIVATFVVMALTGRTLNVISLAGIAFAIGMIVDAAIVVLENIFRLREAGHSRREAAYLGAKQVWGAILVSALTTVLVFIPILIMQLEAGQLFRDIAVAISVSVILSLVVAVTVIPALSSRLLRADDQRPMRIWGVDHLAGWFRAGVMAYVRLTVRSRAIGIFMVAVIAGGAAIASVTFLPRLEYLPEGNRNLVFGLIIPPPGYNLETTETIAQRIENVAQPLWEAAPALETEDGIPAIDSFFFVATPGNSFVGAGAVDPSRAAELIPVLSRPIFAEPGTFGFMTQPSLFGRGVGGGRTIELNVSGQDLDAILGVAGQAAGMVSQLLPRSEGHQFRPIPGLELGAPFDVAYRLIVGVAVGWVAGWVLARIVMSRWGDAATGGANAGLVMIATTFLAYGAAEAFEGYGFLAVFIAARAARGISRGKESDEYARYPHQFSDQIEKILLAILLLWLGVYAVSGILDGTTWGDIGIAALLIFLVRPIAGIIALAPTRGSWLEKGAIAAFGIRGMGSFFYIAFAQGHGDFQEIETVWRITVITVLLSILIHGLLAPLVMRQLRLRRDADTSGAERSAP